MLLLDMPLTPILPHPLVGYSERERDLHPHAKACWRRKKKKIDSRALSLFRSLSIIVTHVEDMGGLWKVWAFKGVESKKVGVKGV